MDGNKPKKRTVFKIIRNRIVAGLFVALPFFITFLVIVWIYRLMLDLVIGPIARQLVRIWAQQSNPEEIPFWAEYILAPIAALVFVLSILFIAGMFFRSRLHRMVDWVLLNVPGVNVIYAAVKNVFDAISTSRDAADKFKRTVLIEFPHPGTKCPAFVTSECKDVGTGKTILSVYVPTTPVPTSGYMLLVPAEEVVELDWDLNETLQAIVSGGITMPDTVHYARLENQTDKIANESAGTEEQDDA